MNLLVLLPAFLSFQEIFIILLVAVVVFGPKRIPEIARGLGEGIRAMKKATDDIKHELMNPVEEVKEELTKPIEDINPIKDIKDTVEESLDSIPDPSQEIKENLDDIVGSVKRN